ncbi:MAG: hypothetical protein ABFD25_07260 [Clostridiaceae bacterium]
MKKYSGRARSYETQNLRNNVRRRKTKRIVKTRFIISSILIVALVTGIFFIIRSINHQIDITESPSDSFVLSPPPIAQPTPTPTPAPSIAADIYPAASKNTAPSLFDFQTHIYVDNVEVDQYKRPESIAFSSGLEYNALKGITTYRGNNYRDTASSYGFADIVEGKLTVLPINKTTNSIGRWRGSACTGQPLIITWSSEIRENMTSLYDEFRNKEGFTEVIVASADGSIYFMELLTGKKTRDPINTGAPTKGTPSLDPRGYPIIYVGQGLNPEGSTTASNDMYFRIYNLINSELLYKFGASDKDPVAFRDWQAYDSSPLIDAATDTLIEPGENGVLYTVKLNTQYDEVAGKLAMNPGPMVKYTYTSSRNSKTGIYGMENSAVGWRNYLIFTDNIGMLQCVNLNTMQLVYANNLENDSDVSMVLEEDPNKERFYLYSGCEYDDSVLGTDNTVGTCYARKIDGLTGEILWTTPFKAFTDTSPQASVDGGILASPILGKAGTTLGGLIVYTVSGFIKDDGSKTALVVALNKETGDIVWKIDMDNDGWTPSSPIPIYTQSGQAYIIQCLFGGTIKLIKVDGGSANVVDSISVRNQEAEEANSFEATPAVFENTIVVGSKSGHFFFLKIS